MLVNKKHLLHTVKIMHLYLVCLTVMFHNTVNADESATCNLPTNIINEIASHSPIANEIMNEIVSGKYKGTTYERLVKFVDTFGSRSVGSTNLENAIDFILNKSEEFHLENVHAEEVLLPHWVRGNESATLLSPTYRPLTMIGLGTSVGTPPEGIRAEALVLNSYDELQERMAEVNGKQVVLNEEFTSYPETAKYRMYGASIVSRYGAVAILIRSVTPFSLNTPHAGLQVYLNNVTKIPAACITMEDAIMLRRMQDRKDTIIIELKMEAKNVAPTISRNFVSEIVGSEEPDQVVVISGHLDTWDNAKGAIDDGGGAILSWKALIILKALGLKPKKTIRVILWTAEEIGILGAFAYAKAHKNETKNLNLVMETDGGTFAPLGLKFSGLPEVGCILQEVLKLLAPINATLLTQPADFGPDLSIWILMGIPAANLYSTIDRYFWFHHTSADTVEVVNAEALDKATALWAVIAYVIANLSIDIPKLLTNTTILNYDTLNYDLLME